MASPGHEGPKRAAVAGALEAGRTRTKAKRPTVAKSVAMRHLRELGVPADRLRHLARVWKDGVSANDVLVWAADLLFEARAAIGTARSAAVAEAHAAAVAAGMAEAEALLSLDVMSEAKAHVQAGKALQVIKDVIASQDTGEGQVVHLVIRMESSTDERRANAGNGAKVGKAGEA